MRLLARLARAAAGRALPADQPDPAGRRAWRPGRSSASIFVSAAMLRKLRSLPARPGLRLLGRAALDSTTRWRTTAAGRRRLALHPSGRAESRSTGRSPGATGLSARVFFPRVAGHGREPGPLARRRALGEADTGSGRSTSPPGRRSGSSNGGSRVRRPDELIVYPTIGQLTRRWHIVQREASETRRGQRHDRSTAAAGVSRPARLPARRQPALDPLADLGPARASRWSRSSSSSTSRTWPSCSTPGCRGRRSLPSSARHVEEAIKFAATVCYETCRQAGRRLLSGWTGATPGPPAGAGLGQAAPRVPRAARHDAGRLGGRPGAAARRPAARDAPRGDLRRRLDPADQPPRGDRADVSPARGPRRAGSSRESRSWTCRGAI